MQEFKATLIQIFSQPSNEQVNKAILEELKKIRSQLKRTERMLANKDTGLPLPSDSDSENEGKKSKDAPPPPEEPKPVEAAPSPPKPPEPVPDDDVIDEDPDNPPWLHDPELGDGEVGITFILVPFELSGIILVYDLCLLVSYPGQDYKRTWRVPFQTSVLGPGLSVRVIRPCSYQ